MDNTSNEAQQLIASGKLKAFLLGTLPVGELAAIIKASADHPEVREELLRLEGMLERSSQGVVPVDKPEVKSRIMERLRLDDWHQDEPGSPPILHAASSRSDYAAWLDLPTMVPPAEYDDPFFIPIGQTTQALTAIVWMRKGSPEEVHTDVVEKFLVIEGCCEIRTADTTTRLGPGSVHSIPLHVVHEVVVISDVPCKVIVQRVAA